MKNEQIKSIPAQVVLGIVVMCMGVLFLLDNLDILNFHNAIHFWPMVFILFGLLKIYDSNTPGGTAVGAVLVVAGVMMTLNRMGYIFLNWHTMWPIILIIVGVSVVYKAMSTRSAIDAKPLAADLANDSVLDVTALLGGFERRVMSQDFRGGEVTAIMGGCSLDLRECSIESEATINVFAMFGGISMRVPPDWTVLLQGTPIMGGFDEKTASPASSSKRLIIKGYAIMGGVDVRN
ncbi:MAG: DUF5668 domain-containing protein [Pseudomonadota bacterium]